MPGREPSMEDILASIKKVIAEEKELRGAGQVTIAAPHAVPDQTEEQPEPEEQPEAEEVLELDQPVVEEMQLPPVDLGPPLIMGDVVVTRIGVLQVATALVLLALTLALLRWTTLGRALRAVASNKEMAAVIGVDVGRVYLQTFALGSLAIVPAALLNSATTGLDPGLGGIIMLTTMVSVIVGGVGSVAGAALGGFLVGAFAYVGANVLLARRGAQHRKRSSGQATETAMQGSGAAIAIGALLVLCKG